ncbi:uncharacterized protein [Solanum tuberosum]|uniref:uncharacterized protein n=1 Tax=Solanum tuberosum TaxID=4113 RepID=UPI0003D26234|nr:PREDICTED: uncharacterized protein LOC102602468 [Solanum tuberosum]KAH0706553.1 hypothetical protein KY289_011629 [Solanum tuberosum]KAH0736610.1 hypothetical protein KY285_012317 [Solanum tuberosum]
MMEKFLPVGRFDDFCCNGDSILLLSGPPSSGKTSLVFQFAINSATASAGNVVFICNRRKLESKPPYLAQGIDVSSDVINRIQMKYVDDEDGIKKYFAAFHMHDPAPVSVIIDDFADFFDQGNCQERYNNTRGRDLAMVRVLALCRNAILCANENGPCQLLLSDTHNGDSPRLLYLYKRWVSSIYVIKGDGFGSYLIRSLGVAKSATTKLAKYSIALQYLVYEGITEDGEQSDE